jgi:hypothetical protein
MNLSDKAIKEFQLIFLEEFNQKISLNKARKYGNQFLQLLVMLINNKETTNTINQTKHA